VLAAVSWSIYLLRIYLLDPWNFLRDRAENSDGEGADGEVSGQDSIVVVADGAGNKVSSLLLNEEKLKLFNDHLHAFLLLVYVFVPPVASLQLKALDCKTLADGSSYLRADTSVDCNSQAYQVFRGIDGMLFALYQCLPLMYIALLCQVHVVHSCGRSRALFCFVLF
jgi:hypothetical protein